MSWGTDFKTNVFLSRQIFRTKVEVEEAIKEKEGQIRTDTELLMMIAMANPKDLATEDEDVLYSMRNRVSDHINDIISTQRELTLLYLYLDAIEDGTAKLTENEN